MFTFSKGLCVFVYFVCVYVSACLYEYIRVNVFHGEKVTFILLKCFQITYWCRGCVGEAVESSKAVPACRLELWCRGQTARSQISTQLCKFTAINVPHRGMWSDQQVQGRFFGESDFESICWRRFNRNNFVFIYFYPKELKTFAHTLLIQYLQTQWKFVLII